MMTATNGSVYTGGYLNDSMEGFGVYKYASGDTFKGMFKGERECGCVWMCGCVLVGVSASERHAENKFHGHGCYTFAANGSKIEGEFADGKPVASANK